MSFNRTTPTIMNTSAIQPSGEDFWSFRTITVLVICCIITILTILGNGLVLMSIKFRLRARSYSDYFIVSLCLADFFVGLFVMPLMTMHSLYLEWPFGIRLCYIWMSIDFTCSTASFLTLASMALDRYWALTAPYFHLRNRSHSSVLIFIISSWAIPFAIWPSSIFISRYYSSDPPACAHPARPFLIVILCAFFYYIPLLFMLACYSRIIVNIKNIEVLIRGTWDSLQLNSSTHDFLPSNQSPVDDNSPLTSSISAFSSLRSLFYKYFRSNRNEYSPTKTSLVINGQTRHPIYPKSRSMPSTNVALKLHSSPQQVLNRRGHRQTTTATFTGQKRATNEIIETTTIKCSPGVDINPNNQDEEQQLTRARLSTRTSSLPAARCIAYYHYPGQATLISSPTVITKAIIEDHQGVTTRLNSINSGNVIERSRSHSHSSAVCSPNEAVPGAGTTDASGHSSSFDPVVDEEHRRLNHRPTQPSRLSTSFNSSRYSQRAIAQFMHERHKARLRRNQKASRMLGILLAVFLICWLPFTISYPTMIFYPNKFPGELQSIIFWFGYVNSLLNPFLYVYSSRNFRQAIVETLCCYSRHRTRQHLRYQWSFRLEHR